MGVYTSALILAAGESKRMGVPKLLLPLGSSTILEYTVDNVLASQVNEYIVVVRSGDVDIMAILTHKPVKVVVNKYYYIGMSTSIISGLQAVSDKTQGILIMLADQPFINSQIIDKLIGKFQENIQKIVVPVYKGKRGHPVIIPVIYKDELLHLEGDKGARALFSKHSDIIVGVSINSASIHLDIDTKDDYKKANELNI